MPSRPPALFGWLADILVGTATGGATMVAAAVAIRVTDASGWWLPFALGVAAVAGGFAGAWRWGDRLACWAASTILRRPEG